MSGPAKEKGTHETETHRKKLQLIASFSYLKSYRNGIYLSTFISVICVRDKLINPFIEVTTNQIQ